MKATITSTDAVVEMRDVRERPFLSRVWEGVTENGIPFTAYIPIVQVARQEDQRQFDEELTYHKHPTEETVRAIDMRFVV